MTRKRWWLIFGIVVLACAILIRLGRDFDGPLYHIEILRAPAPPDPPDEQGRKARMVLHRAVRTLHALELRDSLGSLLGAEPTAASGYRVLVRGDTVSPAVLARIEAALVRGWLETGIDSSHFSVVAVVAIDTPRAASASDVTDGTWVESHGYDVAFSPPSGGRADPCIAVVRFVVAAGGAGDSSPDAIATRAVAYTPGLCAFYALFGEPGSAIAEWLAARDFDVARRTSRGISPRLRSRRRYGFTDEVLHPLRDWQAVEAVRISRPGGPPEHVPYDPLADATALRCADGDRSACSRLVLDPTLRMPAGARDLTGATLFAGRADSIPALLLSEGWSPVLIDPFLSALLNVEGRARFARFWKSSDPPEIAFERAFGRPLDDWVYDWMRHAIGPTRRATRIDASSFVIAALLLAFGLGIALRAADRRTAG